MKNLFNYKGHNYTFKNLLYLRGNSPLHKQGDVTDNQTGEILDITEIDTWRDLYFEDLFSNKEKDNIIKKNKKIEDIAIYKKKYEHNTITKDEMYEYLNLIGQANINPDYNYDKGYIIVNLNKIPKDLTDAEYGKFHKLLVYLSHTQSNKLEYSNGKSISKVKIANLLNYKEVKYFNRYLKKLKKCNLLDERNFGGIDYLIINPAYAKKNMQIDSTIYKMFKNDLDELLTPLQIDYLNMEDDTVEISSMIPIID